MFHPQGGTLATSEILLEETPYLNLTTKGRKTGLQRAVELWFAFDDDKLFFLAHDNSDWWKNVAKYPEVEVEVAEIILSGRGRLVPEKLSHIFSLFRKKYGEDQVERWYSGSRAKRKAVQVEDLRVLGKRPSRKLPLEIAI